MTTTYNIEITYEQYQNLNRNDINGLISFENAGTETNPTVLLNFGLEMDRDHVKEILNI